MELVQVERDVYACLQPENGFGDSNSGLVTAGGGFVVDSFYDLPRTRALLDHYAGVLPEAPRRLLNTHHNGDHCWGNQLFAETGCEIIGHRHCVDYFTKEATPELFVGLAEATDLPPALAGFAGLLRRFDFHDITLTPPTTVLDGDTTVDLDGLTVELRYVGPAHTAGDVVAWLPERGVLFTGDVLFNDCAPLGWEGTFDQWIAALEQLASLDPAVVVPGHGPLCRADRLLAMRDYLAYVRDAARAQYEAGRTVLDAAKHIELGDFLGWQEPERLIFQIDRAYRELAGEPWDAKVDAVRNFGDMAALRAWWVEHGVLAAHPGP